MISTLSPFAGLLLTALIACTAPVRGEEPASPSPATIDGSGPGWKPLAQNDFQTVNCDPGTFSWDGDLIRCTGTPVGVIRSKAAYTNFELVLEWRHLKHAGNSGVFVWASRESLDAMKPGDGKLPAGIEVQILDLGYETNWEKKHGKKSEWFTSHGDVFPVGAEMTPFPPAAPNGKRSFPSQRLTRALKQWNHYYIRCINGEVRLWVNGTEVSGGTGCKPASGFLCLESEGSPVEFRGLRMRVLP